MLVGALDVPERFYVLRVMGERRGRNERGRRERRENVTTDVFLTFILLPTHPKGMLRRADVSLCGIQMYAFIDLTTAQSALAHSQRQSWSHVCLAPADTAL